MLSQPSITGSCLTSERLCLKSSGRKVYGAQHLTTELSRFLEKVIFFIVDPLLSLSAFKERQSRGHIDSPGKVNGSKDKAKQRLYVYMKKRFVERRVLHGVCSGVNIHRYR